MPELDFAIAAIATLATLSAANIDGGTSRHPSLRLIGQLATGTLTTSKESSSTAATESALRLQARVADESAYLDWLCLDASPTSPARLQIQEQSDALNEQAATVDQLVHTLRVFDGATPGSPAQWRAWSRQVPSPRSFAIVTPTTR